MHPEAFGYVDEVAAELSGTDGFVVECGSRNVNGSVRGLFPFAQYCGVDVEPGPGVDLVGDFRKVAFLEPADVVICCEVLEHDADPESLLSKAFQVLRPGGSLIMTCAGVGRAAHSAFDGGPLRPDEHYGNVSADQVDGWLASQGWSWWSVDVLDTDTRCIARK